MSISCHYQVGLSFGSLNLVYIIPTRHLNQPCMPFYESSLQILLIFGSSFENGLYQALTTEWARIIGYFASPINLSKGLGIARSARLTRPSHGPSDPEVRPTPTIHVSTSTYRQHSAKTPALQHSDAQKSRKSNLRILHRRSEERQRHFSVYILSIVK